MISLLSFLNIPSPEHGASISTLSKNPENLEAIPTGSSLRTHRLGTPNTSTFLRSALARELLISLVISSPVLFNLAASSVDLPPGAAHISNTTSPSSIGRTFAGVMALGS